MAKTSSKGVYHDTKNGSLISKVKGLGGGKRIGVRYLLTKCSSVIIDAVVSDGGGRVTPAKKQCKVVQGGLPYIL